MGVEVSPDGLCTQAALARWLGVSEQRVSQYVHEGIIQRTEDGIDPVQALHDLETFGDSSKPNTRRSAYDDDDDVAELGSLDLKTRKLLAEVEYKRERARNERLKADEQEGKLVPLSKVELLFAEIAQITQSQVMSISARVRAQVAGCAGDEDEVGRILDAECRQALSEVAQGVDALPDEW